MPPIVASAVGAIALADWQRGVAIATAGWLLIGHALKALQAHAKDKNGRELRGPRPLAACLHVMHAAALGTRGLDPKSEQDRRKLRVTIHRVVAEEAVQILEYVGGPARAEGASGVGRRRSVRSGVVGRAYTSADPVCFTRPDNDFQKYKREMRDKWAMSPAEADQLDPDRFSHFALPIGSSDSSTVSAIVFLDSSDRDFFTVDVQNLIAAQCIGMAEYTEMGYK